MNDNNQPQRSYSAIECYKRMYPYIKRYKGMVILAIAVTLPIGAMDAVIAWMLKPYMDEVLIAKQMGGSALYIPLFIVLVGITQSVLNFYSTYYNAWVGQKITNDVKRDMFNNLLNRDSKFFDNISSGDVVFNFNSSVEMASSGLVSNLKVLITRIISSLSLSGVLLMHSWRLSIIAIGVLTLAFIPVAKLRKKIRSSTKIMFASLGSLVTSFNEAFHGNKVIASYNLQQKQAGKFDKELKQLFAMSMKIQRRTAMISPMMRFITSIGIAFVIWLGSYFITHGEISTGTFISFLVALMMLYTPIKGLGSTLSQIQVSLMSIEQVFSTLDYQTQVVDKENSYELTNVQGNIKFDHVNFAYDKNTLVLQDINLDIKAGQVVAFVGPSGGGKSTLVSLLPRFYDIQSGSITIDDHNIGDVNLHSLRENLTVVLQNNFLFSGTIRENLLIAKDDATDAQLMDALTKASLLDFINGLDNGLATEIGESGVLLSGGQKQRLSIARAFLKNAPIVILDEATSALDNTSEKKVQEALNKLMQGRTVILIAHRLSTVRSADVIHVLKAGQIVESGKHKELILDEQSEYAKLYRSGNL